MSVFRIALLQINPLPTQSGNLEKGIRYCGFARDLGCDLALFPEMWNTGYQFSPGNPAELEREAIDADSDFFTGFRNAAKQMGMAIAVTYLEKQPGPPRNTVSVIDRHGNCVLTYAKVHTCDFDTEKFLNPGDGFYSAPLDTKNGEVTIGAMICYDREFPESARILMLQGAEVIIVPNACPIEINRRSQLMTRAFENMVGIAMANYPVEQPDCNGHSMAFDGIAYAETETGSFEPRDTLVVEAGEKEGIYIAEFDMDKIREYRGREAWGNAYRRPGKYSLLVSGKREKPFIRNDYRF